MAVTSIWPIKGRVDKVINYARNPEKTHDKERLSELHEIEVLQTKVNRKNEKSSAKFTRPKKGITKQAGEESHRQPG